MIQTKFARWLLERFLSKLEPNAQSEANISSENLNFSADSFRQSWQEAKAGQTFPLSELWERINGS